MVRSRLPFPSPHGGRGRVRGLSIGGVIERIQDRRENSVRPLQHIGVPEAENRKSLRTKPVVPGRVSRAVRGFSMLTPIKFDHKAAVVGGEINDEVADRYLATELGPSKLARTQMVPQLSLCIR